MHAYAVTYSDQHTVELAESGRWIERLIPVEDGHTFIIIASLYRISGASGELIISAMHRAAQFSTTPYFLCSDLNQDPRDSGPIQAVLEEGILSDLAADWAGAEANTTPTFRREGVYKGMNGPGTTRIDVILANAVASAAVTDVSTVWDCTAVFDHTPIAVTLSTEVMQQDVMRAGRPIGIVSDKHCYALKEGMSRYERDARKKQAEHSYKAVAKVFEKNFNEAIDRENVEDAHRIWCLVAEMWLYLAQETNEGQGPCIDKFMRKGIPRRGQAMPIKVGPLVPDLDQGADTGMIGCSNNLLEICASTRELIRVITTAPGDPQQCVGTMPQYTTMNDAWQKLTKAAIKEYAYQQTAEVADEHAPRSHPGGEGVQEIEQPTSDEYVIPQISDQLLKLLAATITNGTLDKSKNRSEVKTQLNLIYDEAKRLTAVQHKRGRTQRMQTMRTTLNNPQNGHTAFFAALRADQYRPTSVMKTEKGLTANLPTILEEFVSKWDAVYNRPKHQPPDYDAFHNKYATYMHNPPAGDLRPNGEQLEAAAKKAKPQSAAGRDAWRPAELALLPSKAWADRAEVLRIITTKGTWPKAYTEVSSPCLRKMEKLDPEAGRDTPAVLDHRLLTIYTQLYRIEAGAWCKNHAEWMQQVIHKDCCGAMPGREAREAAWDAQSAMAAAAEANGELVVALLDYYKFLDSFEPRFYARFLKDIGVHQQFVDLFLDLNTKAIRRARISGVYSEGLTTFNALGQGDSVTLMLALLYVTVQFRLLDEQCPDLGKSAVVDDRSLRGKSEPVQRTFEKIRAFDDMAGHITQPLKLVLLAIGKKAKKWAKGVKFT